MNLGSPLTDELIDFLPQEKEQELEQLTKELRQVNLQQFIQQTGTKVTVLPAEPSEEETDTGEQMAHYTALKTHNRVHTK